jgi:small nuclear ribonucleoprotein (snRNP)-like protein
MIFYSFFKTLVGKEVTVELKNDLSITGVLHSVDQYLNIKLTEISVGEPERHPQASFFFPLLFPLLAFSLSSRVCSQRRTKSQKTRTNKRTAGDGEERVHPRVRGAIRQGKQEGGFEF